MTSSPHPLASLLGPLRYAAAQDFEHLDRVKDLKGVLASAIARASAQGLPGGVLAPFRAELGRVDSADAQERRGSVTRLLRALKEVLPPEAVAPARSAPFELASPPGPRPRKSAPAPPQASPPGAAAPVPASPPPHGPAPEPPPPGASPPAPKKARGGRRKGAPAPKPDADDAPARLLSISPREGPLAQPLRKLGLRLNPRLLAALEKKGVRRVGDVLFLLPRTYEDRRQLKRIAQLRAGERGTVVATVRHVDEGYGRGRRRTFRAVLQDASGSIAATYFQTGPWLKARFPLGKRLVVSGEARVSQWGWEMPHPEVEPAEDLEHSKVHFNRIVPIYPGLERHEQRSLRDLAHALVERSADAVEEPLPDALREKLGLLPLAQALKCLHFPPSDWDLAALETHRSPAHQRLAFDELFFLQLGLALRRRGVKAQEGIAFDTRPERLDRAKGLFPFTLTGAQERVVAELARDMARGEPMNRLLQGDVGSGKTAVALIAAAVAIQDGYQVAVMAPTEILAEQHHRTFSRLLEPLGAKVGLVKGGGTAKERRAVREALAAGTTAVAVGTHALIQESVDFAKLGLVVIDEQHRFGVIQRHALMSKGVRPDVLVMTATPIPRTLAMTLYGDLDVSVVDELPPGRTPIETRVFVEKARPRAWERVAEELAAGHQVYVVYPLVEESEKVDLADATRGAKDVAALFPGARVGLLHGRMKDVEKDAVMASFRRRELDILVCTTVVEVGVDVPNASVMIIEHAERFGLSQLHQLRGRVGRGAARSYCLLFTDYARSPEARTRLEVMEQSADGFQIAEKDLELRGPGEFLGTRQSGVPELAVADLARDQALLGRARDEARAVVEQDPGLERPEHLRLVRALEDRWEGRLKLARVG